MTPNNTKGLRRGLHAIPVLLGMLLLPSALIHARQLAVKRPAAAGISMNTPDKKDGESIAGKWHFVLNTEGGNRESEAVFIQEGTKVTGKWGKTDVAGTFTDGDLNLAFPMTSEEAGMTDTLTLKGKLEGGTLKGTWVFSSYSGTFTGTRSE